MTARPLTVAANLGLVHRVVARYQGHATRLGIDLDDLVQAGTIGLAHAIERFDPARGCQLSTIATFWIRHRIQRELANHGRTIRIPVHALESKRCHGIPTVSLATPVHEGASIGDLLSADAEPADGAVERRERERFAGELMCELTPRERMVIEGRFKRELTLAEIAQTFTPPLSRERVRQIEAEALSKMRSAAAKREREAERSIQQRRCG